MLSLSELVVGGAHIPPEMLEGRERIDWEAVEEEGVRAGMGAVEAEDCAGAFWLRVGRLLDMGKRKKG